MMEKGIVEFLTCYKWIHNTKVTDFFSEKIWENFPLQWLETLNTLKTEDMNLIPYGLIKDEWPSTFINFLKTSISFGQKRYNIQQYHVNKSLHISSVKGMSPKKLHEVERMVTFLKEFLQNNDCHYVVDIGSGLAYLDLALAELGFKVIGLEIDPLKASKANKRAEKEGLSSNFESFSLEITNDESSIASFKALIETKFPRGKEICLVGLHCCGDLSPAIIELFLKVSTIKHLIFFGCCYHSMATEGSNFKNFPLSKKYHLLKGNFNCCSMRLGAQQTRSSWKNQTSDDHKRHMLNVSFRAILELAAKTNNCQFKKLKRKLAQVTCETTFELYMNDVLSRSTISEWNHLEDIRKLYKEYESFNRYIEPFTMLQVLFQPIIEYLILNDRYEYIREHVNDCNLFQLFQDETSPRNCAVVANK